MMEAWRRDINTVYTVNWKPVSLKSLLLLLLILLLCRICFAQEEEVLRKKRSEWLTILKEHKETKLRRAAVIALEVIGPRAKGVLDGLFDAEANDPDPEVRREIALALGRMGSEARGAADDSGQVLRHD